MLNLSTEHYSNLKGYYFVQPLSVVDDDVGFDIQPLLVQRLSENATLPKRATPCAAGLDLYSSCNCEINPRSHITVFTDIAVRIPKSYYGRIAARSGLASKFGIDVGAGVVDSDYRGNVGVVLFNHSDELFVITKGDRIGQLILEKIGICDVKEVNNLTDDNSNDNNSNTRGTKGFGSSGK